MQEYLAHRVIDFLRSNGIDYMKVDYNETIGLGVTVRKVWAKGCMSRFWQVSIFARIRRELPDLVLELCASGGHRLCHSFLELACMASFSDAHECDEIPIIAANMHRMILPAPEPDLGGGQGRAAAKSCTPNLQRAFRAALLSGEPDALSAAQWTIMDEGTAFYGKAASIIDHGVSQRFVSRIVSYAHPGLAGSRAAR